MTNNSHIITVEITSFSYKRPLPPNLFTDAPGKHGGGFVFDCRCLPNPGREEQYKSRTGLELEVIEYLEKSKEVQDFKAHTFAIVNAAIQNYMHRNFDFLSVAFGCTGGQHRSVYFTEQLSRHLLKSFSPRVATTVCHSNLDSAGRPLEQNKPPLH
jgi:RNase adaptor protein for sRNA GlmZ degradation